MSIEIAVVNGTTPTTTTTKSFESSGFGTPQAAIIITSMANTTNNPADDSIIGISFTDGTTTQGMSASAEDNQGTTDTYRADSARASLLVDIDGVGTVVAGNFDSWATNGITIDFTTVDGGLAYYLTVILIKGCTDYDVSRLQLTTTGVNDFTGIGFKPNLVLTAGVAYNASGIGTQAVINFGAAHNNSSDSVSQGCVAYYNGAGQTSAVAGTITRNDACLVQIFSDSQAYAGTAQDFDANGFSINTGADSPGNDYFIAMSLDTGDTNGVSVDVVSSPTSTGTWNVEDPAFEPQAVILGMTGGPTVNTLKTDDPVYLGIGAFDDTTESCSGIASDDGAGTSDEASNHSTSNAVQVYDYISGYAKHSEGSFSSFDSLGYNMSFPTTVNGTARQWLSIAIKAAAAGGPIEELPPIGSLTLTGITPSVTFNGTIEQLPPVGSLSITGFAPGVAKVGNTAEAPPAGNLNLFSYAPDAVIAGNVVAIPGAGSLALTGFAPQLAQVSATIEVPPAGTLTLTGYAPQTDVVGSVVGEIPPGYLRLVSFNPNVNNPSLVETVKPTAGGGKRAKRRKVIIGGNQYFIETQQQLLMLLEEYRQSQMDLLVEEVVKDKSPRKIKLLASQIKRTETRIKKEGGHPWEEEEELLLMLA